MSDENLIVVANWKMQLGVPESIELAKKIKKGAPKKGPEVVICPSFVSLAKVADILKGSNIKLGAQDCFWEEKGTYTGEVSATYLREVGCEFVIVGHSERRKHLKETDEMVHRKVKMALVAGLTPIVCVGETFDQRQQGATDSILIQQTIKAFEGIKLGLDQQVLIAYEPIWAISPSPHNITPDQVIDLHQVIRQTLFDFFPASLVKNNFRIIFGGSVDSNDVAGFVSLENTSGVLVGRASLKAEEFISIIKTV